MGWPTSFYAVSGMRFLMAQLEFVIFVCPKLNKFEEKKIFF